MVTYLGAYMIAVLGIACPPTPVGGPGALACVPPPIRFQERTVTRYRPEYRTEYREVQRTVYRTVPETYEKEITETVMVPCWREEQRQRTVMVPVKGSMMLLTKSSVPVSGNLRCTSSARPMRTGTSVGLAMTPLSMSVLIRR